MHQGMRKKLVSKLREKGIHDEAVLDAINRVPRHLFMDSSFLKFAYIDQAFPIAEGQTISQPYTVAKQTELLGIQPHMKVLEIGTGSGYQAAVLATMGARVYTMERIRNLFINVQVYLKKMNLNIQFFYGDGYKGLPAFAPFDRILITAAIPEIPELLLCQLVIGGILVAPTGSANAQTMTRIIRTGEKSFKSSHHGYFVFVPMRKGKA
ncbi:MAG: protein-L-isoaspartate(D-aspartate) O-methyltransferase [Bacteroidales bacterium]|nr:protein-L-isoaspartate(D-aspartate) O-methyltransferase [Bacteroidales bacterium]